MCLMKVIGERGGEGARGGGDEGSRWMVQRRK